ncbi:MAG TPA: 3-oxo-tetronate 4-phosphate decarboxylase [Azospirillaceae bacterium]|nr:3-oxo-tetronate 4-phosphate decarboxylase [Azospirillaceae bacterium]
MTMTDEDLRAEICRVGRSLFDRRFTHGATGNLSVRVEGGFLMTPTDASLGSLAPGSLSLLSDDGRHLSGDPPTKEAALHLAMYRVRPELGAVVHLHGTHAVAVSCLRGLDASDLLPPLTAYYAMRVGQLPLIPFFAPGDPDMAEAVAERARESHAVMLANHGPVVGGRTLARAVQAIEELEETARLYLLLRGSDVRALTPDQVDLVRSRYPF